MIDRATCRTSRRGLLGAAAVAVACAVLLGASPAFAATFDDENVISNDNFRATYSLSRSDVQAFLETLPGILDTYKAKDHLGVTKPASQMIVEASRAWNVSPKVMLCLLQKEQSLLTDPSPSEEQLREACGCGVYSGSTNRYPGFGKQIWNAARKLSTYEVTFNWYPGKRVKVSRTLTITPKNVSTWSLYIYNPSIHGNQLFWTVYVRYFGDPLYPPRYRPVYQFRNTRTRTFLYLTSPAQRYRLLRHPGNWKYEKIAWTVDASVTANALKLYRLHNLNTQAYYLTIWEREKTRMDATAAWKLDGPITRVSRLTTGTPVFQLYNRSSHAYFYTPWTRDRDRMVASYGFKTQKVAFYLGREETSASVAAQLP